MHSKIASELLAALEPKGDVRYWEPFGHLTCPPDYTTDTPA